MVVASVGGRVHGLGGVAEEIAGFSLRLPNQLRSQTAPGDIRLTELLEWIRRAHS